ncbi:MAG: flagellar biosynthetic protein FliO [Firmicutes bacterium]|nr:flagellar biosynthetic protein FliO [Bacillota bacterium]
MGATVISMFQHGAHAAAQGPAVPASASWAAAAVLAAAALLALGLRRAGGARAGAVPWRPAGAGPGMRVLSRLALGPGRYLCVVEVGDRAFLVAVGGEVRLMAEVEARLPRSRRRRRAMAQDLLAEGAAALAAAGEGAAGGREPAEAPPSAVAVALDRHAAAHVPKASSPREGPDEAEAAQFFSRLLDASLRRMEAADRRLMGQAGEGTAEGGEGA